MKKVCLVLCVILALWSCEDDDKNIVINQPEELCDSLDILYSNDIVPLLQRNGCTESYCHGGGAAGYFLTDYVNTKSAAENPKFLRSIRHETGVSPMPKGRDKMSDEDIQMVECWIQSGFRE